MTRYELNLDSLTTTNRPYILVHIIFVLWRSFAVEHLHGYTDAGRHVFTLQDAYWESGELIAQIKSK